MKRYSKPLGNLLDFKQDFFESNDKKLEEFKKIASVYKSQSLRRECKNCSLPMDFSSLETFTKLGVEYAFCPECGHCNGKHEETDVFCQSLYTDNKGKKYSESYTESDEQRYKQRVKQIYLPKADFLKDALIEKKDFPVSLSDFGAGAGYFVSAVKECGFSDVVGYEPSEALTSFGNAMLGQGSLVNHKIDKTVKLIEKSDAKVVSFIGVLEHMQNPRDILKAVSKNDNIKYVFFSVPLFSPSVVFETVFPEIMPRHLTAGHTHLYTEQSIDYFCKEFNFKKISEWWFGLDVTDLYRSILVSLQKMDTNQKPLIDYVKDNLTPLLDKMQEVIDKKKLSSEVHMLVGKKII